MRKGRVALMVVMMVLMIPAAGLAFELGAKLGVTKKSGSVIGCQMKKHAQGSLFWGVHVGHTHIERGTGSGYVDVRYIEIYPFIDFYPYKSRHVNFFLRGGVGINRWKAKLGDDNGTYDNRAEDMDAMAVLGVGMNFFQGFELTAIYNKVFTSEIYDVEYLNFTIGYNFDFSSKIEAQF